MTHLMRSFATAVMTTFLIAAGLVAITTVPAEACNSKIETCPKKTTTTTAGDDNITSSGNKNAPINTGGSSCSVYANGGGMGMYCVTLGGGTLKTLRERFGNQKFQQCRYSPLPDTVEPPVQREP